MTIKMTITTTTTTTTPHYVSLFRLLVAGTRSGRRWWRRRVNDDLGEGRFRAPKDLDRIFRHFRRKWVRPMSYRQAEVVTPWTIQRRRWPRERGRPSEG